MTNTPIKKILLELKTFDSQAYENLDLDRLVIFAMASLERKKIPLYFDYITVGLFKMFPDKFSMANFAQYPDTNRINKSLRRLVDPKRKNWATGNLENGFYLTDLGKEIGMQTKNLLTHPIQQKTKRSTTQRSRGRSPQEDVVEIENSQLFQKWAEKNYKATEYEVLSFLKAVPYTPKHLLFKYIEQLKQSATTVKNKKVINFLNWLENKFKNLFQ